MSLKWIGVALILFGCGGCGFCAAAAGKREKRVLEALLYSIEFMKSELRFNLKKLPAICKETAKISNGPIREVFDKLAQELERQFEPDVASCMVSAIEKVHSLPKSARRLLQQLGKTLGQFDLTGQLNELENLAISCENELKICCLGQEERLRGYQTLGLCTGAALAILLM